MIAFSYILQFCLPFFIKHAIALQITQMPPNAVSRPSETVTSCPGLDQLQEKGTNNETGVLFEGDADTNDGALAADITQFKKAEKRKLKLVWRNIILFGYLHLAAVYGAYLLLAQAKWATIAFCTYI